MPLIPTISPAPNVDLLSQGVYTAHSPEWTLTNATGFHALAWSRSHVDCGSLNGLSPP